MYNGRETETGQEAEGKGKGDRGKCRKGHGRDDHLCSSQEMPGARNEGNSDSKNGTTRQGAGDDTCRQGEKSK